MWTWLGKQWLLLIIGFPFIFLGAISDLFVPDYIGKIVDALTEEEYYGDKGVFGRLEEWMVILAIGVVCTFIQKVIYGITGERLGNDLRKDLFHAIIDKDVGFFDENRTGELLSRISSDTQVVQEGLTLAVAMAITEAAKTICVIAILFYYSWPLACLVFVCMSP